MYQRGAIINSGRTSHFYGLSAHPPLVHDQQIADGPWTTLVRLAHASDFHITDTESPARLDFLGDIADDPRYEQPLPTLRPQQLTSTHAAAATLRAIGRIADNGRLDCAVLTGDLLDNGQTNELDRLVTMIRGGTVATSTVAGTVDGAQGDKWIDSKLWRPSDPDNYWTLNYGFPCGAEILAAISRPIEVPPLRLPVLLARGNHDALLAGTVAWTPTLERLAVGEVKACELPAALPRHNLKKQFYSEPETLFTGTAIRVAADGRRRPVAGDGFPLVFNADAQRISRNDYLVRPNNRIAIVVLDTVDPDGHPAGVVSVEQADWLQDTLTALEDEIVIVASHHGPSHHHVTQPARGRLTGPEVVALLGRYSSVALWLTGHTHIATTTRHQPDGQRGFWEVTASSIIDWPNQFQTIELFENPEGALAVVIEQHHYDTTGVTGDLAGLHRLLAANQAGFGQIFPGPDIAGGRDCVLQLGVG